MRRVTVSRVLKQLLCAFLCTASALSVALWLWVESAAPPAERSARARGCALCHGSEWQRQLHPALRRRQPGSAISPPLQAALQQRHPVLSHGAESELTDWLAAQQLPLLATANREQAGATLYRSKCAACHGLSGEGQPGLYPPLRGSEWLTEQPSRLPEILTYGLKGPITVRGEQWNSTMLPPGLNTTEQQEQIIHYIREHFTAR